MLIGEDRPMRIAELTVSHYRGWRKPAIWKPGTRSVLMGPNNGGKTALLNAIDLVLNPFRDAYRDRLSVWDYPDCETEKPAEITIVLDDLSPNDRDHFEPYLEGQRDDGTFGGWDSPAEEFDTGNLVLRLAFRGEFGEPSRAFFARPEAGEAPVRQADKIRIGWHYVPASLDPGHELAFYRNSVLSRLFERDDLSEPLDAIRSAIDAAKGPLLQHQTVAHTRMRLQESAQCLGLAPPGDPLDFAVAGLSDRRVLQSLQLVMQGHQSPVHLPLDSHGRGVLRVLLFAALLQSAQAEEGNLILAVEEPEQNLEPINQRLVARSLLLAEETSSRQTLITTHSAEVAGTVPLSMLHLVREFADGRGVRSLRDALPAEHKFFELHARTALVSGIYANTVLLVEGPTERGALPVFWRAHRPGNGLDENRIELVDCESVNKMPSFVRFFRALGIPVIALCDADKPTACAKILAAKPNLFLRWSTHGDWEGVLAAEADIQELATGVESARSTLGLWEDHAIQLSGCLKLEVGDSLHLAAASDIPALVVGYQDDADRRAALLAILRGKSGLDFKSPIYSRTICEGLTTVPTTVAQMIDHVHQASSGDTSALGSHDL